MLSATVRGCEHVRKRMQVNGNRCEYACEEVLISVNGSNCDSMWALMSKPKWECE